LGDFVCVDRINIPGLNVSRGGSFSREKPEKRPKVRIIDFMLTWQTSEVVVLQRLTGSNPTPKCHVNLRSCHRMSSPLDQPGRATELVWSHGSSSTDLNPCSTTTYAAGSRARASVRGRWVGVGSKHPILPSLTQPEHLTHLFLPGRRDPRPPGRPRSRPLVSSPRPSGWLRGERRRPSPWPTPRPS
jgi:hypothetical protein